MKLENRTILITGSTSGNTIIITGRNQKKRNLNLNQDHGLDDVTREIDINSSGPVRMVQQFLPHLKSRTGR